MFRRISILLALTILLLGLSTPLLAQARNARVAGVYWNVGSIEGLPPIYTTVTYHDDGTTEFDSQFASKGLAPSKNTPCYGVYRFTGPRESESVWIALGFDLNGMPYWANRITRTDNWADDFSSNEGEFEWRRYDLTMGEDPLDPEGGTVVAVGTFTETRLQLPRERGITGLRPMMERIP